METIAVIGTGPVGRTLADAWVGAGHQVAIGSRNPGEAPSPAGAAVTDPHATPAAFATVDSLAGLWFALVFGRGHDRRLAFRVLTDSGSV